MISKLEQEYKNNNLAKYLETLEEKDLFIALKSLLSDKRVYDFAGIISNVVEEIQYRSIDQCKNETLVSSR